MVRGAVVVLEKLVVYATCPDGRGATLLVTVAWTVGGLKVVMRLELKDALETVGLVEESDRPGTEKGPRVVTGAGPEVLVKQMSVELGQAPLPVKE